MRESSRVKTTCPYCGVGCGVIAGRETDGTVSVRGDPDHPANFGRLCSKGSALAETTGLEDRLLTPEIGGRPAGWDEALDLVAAGFAGAIARHGPDSVAFYVSGQLLTEDYYVANKLMKGFIGSANIDTNSRLCMASAVAGHRRAFGADTVPGTYADLECADLAVLVGSNLAWCHPVLYQRLAAAKAARPEMRVVLIDPRRTMTADVADLHLPIRPDGDVPLFLGLLSYLAETDALDRTYIDTHCTGFDDALAAARTLSFDQVVRQTGLGPQDLTRFYDLFGRTQKAVTVYSQGVNQSLAGTDKVNAIINCHLATGRLGRPGMGPFSVTGQPNAMGGREVGGLANVLAAHMEIEKAADRDRVRRFWRAPAIAERPGLKAVDLFQAVADGGIKALWIMATNPVDTLPDGTAVEAAIRACPFVVVSDVAAATDTIRHAHVKLPAAAWGEKDGTVTNSERRISRQRAFLPLPNAAKPDWWIICEVAKRMGFADAFDYAGPAAIFAEHAALSAFENGGTRAFDLGAYAEIDTSAYEGLAPFQWPAPPGRKADGDMRFFADGGFFTPDRKAHIVPVTASSTDPLTTAFPLTLNTGRIRDHWHTMTRTGKSPRLSQHLAEPYAEIHPADAVRAGVGEADIVRVSSANGSILVRALISDRQRPGSIFVPMHWTDQFAANGRADRLVPPNVDRISGQPASKNVPVAITPFVASAYAFAVSRRKPARIDAEYWALARCAEGWRIELAFKENRDWTRFANDLFTMPAGTEMLSYRDMVGGHQRYASFEGERLSGVLLVAAEPVAAPRNWLVEQLSASCTDYLSRQAVLAGRPGQGCADRGATVCVCFGVGASQIVGAVAAGCRTLEAIGQRLQAGSNCGSCRAEIRSIIDAYCLRAAE